MLGICPRAPSCPRQAPFKTPTTRARYGRALCTQQPRPRRATFRLTPSSYSCPHKSHKSSREFAYHRVGIVGADRCDVFLLVRRCSQVNLERAAARMRMSTMTMTNVTTILPGRWKVRSRARCDTLFAHTLFLFPPWMIHDWRYVACERPSNRGLIDAVRFGSQAVCSPCKRDQSVSARRDIPRNIRGTVTRAFRYRQGCGRRISNDIGVLDKEIQGQSQPRAIRSSLQTRLTRHEIPRKIGDSYSCMQWRQ